jgi:spoIIIJ-associated protein
VTEEEAMTVEEQVELVGKFVRGVVERFGYEATTTTRVEDDRLYVDVTGEDLGLLIGPRGSTLDALQELARTVVQRRGDERALRVVVDVAGFRARRAAALGEFTRRRAAEVLETGIPEALEPMSAADRKIVHDTVSLIEGLETGSEGLEPERYVVIRPAARGEPQSAPETG